MKKEIILSAPVSLMENEEGKLEGKFKGIAYSGKPIEQYGWTKNLIIDLSDVRFKSKVPILKGHDHEKIAGNAKLQVLNNQLMIEGKLAKSSAYAEEIKSLAEDGFEWELSVGLGPDVRRTTLDEDVEMVVNGQTIKGPAMILSRAHVSEVSFVAVGADRSAIANVFNEQKGEIEMSTEPKKTEPKKEAPVAEGITFSAEEWNEFVLACSCQSGASKDDVKATMEKKKDEMAKKIKELQAELKKYKASEKKKELMEAAEGKVTLSEEKIESLLADEVKFSAYIEFLTDVEKKEAKKQIEAKFAEKTELAPEGKTTTLSAEEKANARRAEARKLVEEGKYKNFREAIAALPEENY